jgi:two-component system response regulator YesN
VKEELSELAQSYNEAVTALRNKAYLGKNRIIPYDLITDSGQSSFYYPNETEKQIINSLKCLDQGVIHKKLGDVIEMLRGNTISFQQGKNTALRLTFAGISALEEIGIPINQCPGTSEQLLSELEMLETYTELKEWLINRYDSLIEWVRQNESTRYKCFVTRAIQYVREHYRSRITLSDVAAAVYVTPNYFSRLFREETGRTFTDWLNEFRVEKAKEYLSNLKLKLYEISDRVGYHDYKYFTLNFKKYAGCSPAVYRDRLLNHR